MKSFRKLIIINFQSHHHTELDFVFGLNVLVGHSDSGKSAIMRALRWVLFNTPRGTDFITTNATECKVQLILDDGTEITRLRSKATNRYVLKKADGEEHIFEAFGNSVPKEIIDAHQISAIRLDQKDYFLNFGMQLEAPFLLADSAGSKAKMIGHISGAYVIDSALKEAGADRYNKSLEIKRLESQKDDLEQKLLLYEGLADEEQALEQADAFYLSAFQNKDKLEKIKILSDKLYAAMQEVEALKPKIKIKEKLHIVSEYMQRIEKLHLSHHTLKRLHTSLERIHNEKVAAQSTLTKLAYTDQLSDLVLKLESSNTVIKSHGTLLTRLKNTDVQINQLKATILRYRPAKNAQTFLEGTERKNLRLQKLISLSNNIQGLRIKISTGQQFCLERKSQLLKLSDELVTLIQRLGKCPTCGSQIEQALIEKLLLEYRGGFEGAAAGRAD